MINVNHVRTSYEALQWMTEVTLATLEGLLERKSSPKSEIKRNLVIAQQGIDWVKEFQVPGTEFTPGSRMIEIIVKYNGKVLPYLEALSKGTWDGNTIIKIC